MNDHFDLVVLGAGPAGEKGAAQAAFFGKRVCVIERAPKPGGAAVTAGTFPSKSLRETALLLAALRRHRVGGVKVAVDPAYAITDFMQRERATAEAEWARIEENLRRHGIVTLQGTASFVNPRMVEVSRYRAPAMRISADVFLVATGAAPRRPASVPFDDRHVVDWEGLIRLAKVPRRLIVVGGGVIECEYACTFAALGARVTVLSGRDRLLERLDADVSEALRREMTARFDVAVQLGTPITGVRVERGEAHVTLADGTTRAGDVVLYGSGRVGNTADLALEVPGVRTNARGFVEVDDGFRTSVPYVYAAGDVIGFPAQASTAMEQARVAICRAFDLKYKQRISPVPPYTVFTIPEIAAVGETEDSARAKGIRYEIGCARFRGNPRGQLLGETMGFIKLIFRPEDQRLLGVSIIGEGAAELIHTGMACLMFGGTIDFFIQSVFAYPALSDTYKYAAYDGLQRLARRITRETGLQRTGGMPTVT